MSDSSDGNGPKLLPPGLQPGGSWLPAIRQEVRDVLATEAYVRVLRPLPRFLVLLLRPWLHPPVFGKRADEQSCDCPPASH